MGCSISLWKYEIGGDDMSKLTVADAAIKLGVSKEAIHNRIRRGSLESVVENDVKLVIIDIKKVTKSRW